MAVYTIRRDRKISLLYILTSNVIRNRAVLYNYLGILRIILYFFLRPR